MSSDKALSRFHQPIAVPGRRLMHAIPLAFVKKKVVGGGGRATNHEVPLIPFIDFLLCIVCFLLASFSASGELPVDKNVKLPNAENVMDMTEAPRWLRVRCGTQEWKSFTQVFGRHQK